MTLNRKPAAVAALVAATLFGTGVGAASAGADDGTDGYIWSESTPTDVPVGVGTDADGTDGEGTDGYTWAD
jgi:hypothetical protein